MAGMDKPNTPYRHEKEDEIIEAYLSGMAMRVVAEKLQVSEAKVFKVVKSRGLSRNDFKGTRNPFYGKKHTKEFCETISRQNKGKRPPNKGKSKYRATKYVPGLTVHIWQVNAKARNIEWNITDIEIDALWEKQGGLCALTGQPLSSDYNADKHVGVSLDRIENDIGYLPDNIQLVTGMANICKNILDNDSFIELCRKVAETHGNG